MVTTKTHRLQSTCQLKKKKTIDEKIYISPEGSIKDLFQNLRRFRLQTSGTVYITSQLSNFSERSTCKAIFLCKNIKKEEECHIHAGANYISLLNICKSNIDSHACEQ